MRQSLRPDVDDLEAEQEAFLKSGSVPSTRVSRLKPQIKDLGLQAEESGVEADKVRQTYDSNASPSIDGVLGEVMERQVDAAMPPRLPTGNSVAGFPKARKQSQFAFKKRQQRGDQPLRASTTAPATAPMTSEQAEIHSENVQAIQNMTEEEILEAQNEIKAALSASSLEFLKARRNQPKQALAPGIKTSDDSKQSTGSIACNVPDHFSTPQPHAGPTIDQGRGHNKLDSEAASAESESGPMDALLSMSPGSTYNHTGMAQSSSAGSGQDKLAKLSENAGVSSGESDESRGESSTLPSRTEGPKILQLPTSLPGNGNGASDVRVERARFSMLGELVGYAPDNSATNATERDILRWSGEDGYTVREACILARSSQPMQRAAACHLLGAIIRKLSPFLRTPESLKPVECLEGGAGKGGAEGPNALQGAWDMMLRKSQTVAVLRFCLDDATPAVHQAAASALADLTTPVSLFLHSRPGVPDLEHLRYKRVTADSSWQSMASIQAECQAKDGEDPPDEQNPDAADNWDLHQELLHTKILERVQRLLRGGSISLQTSLLRLVLNLASATKAGAKSVSEAAALLDRILQLETAIASSKDDGNRSWEKTLSPNGDDSSGAAKPTGSSSDANISSHQRVTTLKIFKQVARASSHAANRVLNAGLSQTLKAILASEALTLESQTTQAEALDVCRVLWQEHQVSVLSFDEVFPSICWHLESTEESFERCARQTADLICAAWTFATACLRPSTDALISLDCAQALVKEAANNLAILKLALESCQSDVHPKLSASSRESLEQSLAICKVSAKFALAAHDVVGQDCEELVRATLSRLQECQNALNKILVQSISMSRSGSQVLAERSSLFLVSLLQTSLAARLESAEESTANWASWQDVADGLAKLILSSTDRSASLILEPEEIGDMWLVLPYSELLVGILTRLAQTKEFKDGPEAEAQGTGSTSHLQACLLLPSRLPPGSEALALDAMTYIFRPSSVATLLQQAQLALESPYLEASETSRFQEDRFAADASQESRLEGLAVPRAGDSDSLKATANKPVHAHVPEESRYAELSVKGEVAPDRKSMGSLEDSTPGAQLPDTSHASKKLLEAFALSFLRLLPESDAGNAHPTQSKSKQKTSKPNKHYVHGDSEGSFLPLKPEWMYDWLRTSKDMTTLSNSLSNGLDAIPEDAPLPASPETFLAESLTALAVSWTAFLLGVELTSECTNPASNTGAKIKLLFAALFHRDSEDVNALPLWQISEAKPYLSALIRILFNRAEKQGWCAGQPISKGAKSHNKLHMFCEISATDVEHWSAEFTQTQFGDPFLGECLGNLLGSEAPSELKIALLRSIADEGGMQFLRPQPPVLAHTAPSSAPSLELIETCIELVVKGAFRKCLKGSRMYEWLMATLKKGFTGSGVMTYGKKRQAVNKLRAVKSREAIEIETELKCL